MLISLAHQQGHQRKYLSFIANKLATKGHFTHETESP